MQVVNVQPDVSNILNTFCKYGMIPYDDPVSGGYPVLIDGKVVGWLHKNMAYLFVMKMRGLKSLGAEKVSGLLCVFLCVLYFYFLIISDQLLIGSEFIYFILIEVGDILIDVGDILIVLFYKALHQLNSLTLA